MTYPDGTVADQRVLRGVAASVRWYNVDQDGDAAAAAGAVTVGIVDADGTTVVAAGTATSAGALLGEYTATLTAAQTATLDTLTATWADAGTATSHATTVEIVGGYFFSTAELRDSDDELEDVAAYSSARIVLQRHFAEIEAEWICDVAFVPRARRAVLSGNGDADILALDNMVRTIRSVTIDGTAYTAAQIADLATTGTDQDRIRHTGGDVWPYGHDNIVIVYEYGMTRPPVDLASAAMHRTRYLLNHRETGIPDNATSYSPDGGGTFELGKPGRYATGLERVDAVYQRHSLRPVDGDGGSGAAAPSGYARTFDFDPQYGSLFHGGRS